MQTKLNRLRPYAAKYIFGIAVFSSFHRYAQLLDILRVFLILYSLGLWMSWAGFGIFVSTPLSKQVALMATLKVILQPTQYLSFFCVIIRVGQTRMHSFSSNKTVSMKFLRAGKIKTT